MRAEVKMPSLGYDMEAGKIVEQGNHGELLARRGAYYRMARS